MNFQNEKNSIEIQLNCLKQNTYQLKNHFVILQMVQGCSELNFLQFNENKQVEF